MTQKHSHETEIKRQILEKAYELIKNEEDWIKGVDAIDIHGEETVPDDPEACQFCLNGAINAASERFEDFDVIRNCYPTEYHEAVYKLRKEIHKEIVKRTGDREHLFPSQAMTNYNDNLHRTHQDILNIILTVLKNIKGEQHENK